MTETIYNAHIVILKWFFQIYTFWYQTVVLINECIRSSLVPRGTIVVLGMKAMKYDKYILV
jgi:hypothetical protein